MTIKQCKCCCCNRYEDDSRDNLSGPMDTLWASADMTLTAQAVNLFKFDKLMSSTTIEQLAALVVAERRALQSELKRLQRLARKLQAIKEALS